MREEAEAGRRREEEVGRDQEEKENEKSDVWGLGRVGGGRESGGCCEWSESGRGGRGRTGWLGSVKTWFCTWNGLVRNPNLEILHQWSRNTCDLNAQLTLPPRARIPLNTLGTALSSHIIDRVLHDRRQLLHLLALGRAVSNQSAYLTATTTTAWCDTSWLLPYVQGMVLHEIS